MEDMSLIDAARKGPSMTRELFLECLAHDTKANGWEWYLTDNSALRLHGDAYCCPLTAWCVMDARGMLEAARALGVSEDDAYAIAATADNLTRHRRFDPILRQQLLKACGLEVTP